MTSATGPQTISKKTAYLRLALVSLVALGITAIGIVFLYIEAPVQGQACYVEHATTQDAIGHALACDFKVGGNHELVWQHASELEVQGDRSPEAP